MATNTDNSITLNVANQDTENSITNYNYAYVFDMVGPLNLANAGISQNVSSNNSNINIIWSDAFYYAKIYNQAVMAGKWYYAPPVQGAGNTTINGNNNHIQDSSMDNLWVNGDGNLIELFGPENLLLAGNGNTVNANWSGSAVDISGSSDVVNEHGSYGTVIVDQFTTLADINDYGSYNQENIYADGVKTTLYGNNGQVFTVGNNEVTYVYNDGGTNNIFDAGHNNTAVLDGNNSGVTIKSNATNATVMLNHANTSATFLSNSSTNHVLVMGKSLILQGSSAIITLEGSNETLDVSELALGDIFEKPGNDSTLIGNNDHHIFIHYLSTIVNTNNAPVDVAVGLQYSNHTTLSPLFVLAKS